MVRSEKNCTSIEGCLAVQTASQVIDLRRIEEESVQVDNDDDLQFND
jgi:hypothetical protein